MRLFLFDLDGTLVTTGGAGLKALDNAFNDLFGLKFVVPQINPSGKTDPAIFREIVQRFLGRDTGGAELQLIAETYLHYLEEQMNGNTVTKSFPGVREFLSVLQGHPDVVFGLGTGNLERGAHLKLAPTGLGPFFAFGGFGSDSEDRAELLKVGKQRAEAIAGKAILDDDVYVIGDTELDVAAARRAGFRAVTVATGSRSYAELEAVKPDFMMHDMTEAGNLLGQIENQ